jgi:hypothetical protein
MASLQVFLSEDFSVNYITNWYYPSLKGGKLSLTYDSNRVTEEKASVIALTNLGGNIPINYGVEGNELG